MIQGVNEETLWGYIEKMAWDRPEFYAIEKLKRLRPEIPESELLLKLIKILVEIQDNYKEIVFNCKMLHVSNDPNIAKKLRDI